MHPDPSGAGLRLAHSHPFSSNQTAEKSTCQLYTACSSPNLRGPALSDPEELSRCHRCVGTHADASGHEVGSTEDILDILRLGIGGGILSRWGIGKGEALCLEMLMKWEMGVQRGQRWDCGRFPPHQGMLSRAADGSNFCEVVVAVEPFEEGVCAIRSQTRRNSRLVVCQKRKFGSARKHRADIPSALIHISTGVVYASPGVVNIPP